MSDHTAFLFSPPNPLVNQMEHRHRNGWWPNLVFKIFVIILLIAELIYVYYILNPGVTSCNKTTNDPPAPSVTVMSVNQTSSTQNVTPVTAEDKLCDSTVTLTTINYALCYGSIIKQNCHYVRIYPRKEHWQSVLLPIWRCKQIHSKLSYCNNISSDCFQTETFLNINNIVYFRIDKNREIENITLSSGFGRERYLIEIGDLAIFKIVTEKCTK